MDIRKWLDDNGLLYLWAKIKSAFVAKEEGKGLSTNDYTNAEKEKLGSVEQGANNYTLPVASSNTVGGVKVGSGLEIKSDGTLNSTYGGTADSVEWTGVLHTPTTLEGYGITDVASGAEVNVQADWNETNTNADEFIKNKPTIPSATSQLTNDSGFLTTHQDISGKADKATTLSGYGINDAYTKDQIDSKISSTIRPQPSTAFAGLPVPSSANLGFQYNVTDSFTTDERFVDGTGKAYPAGSNVVVVESNGVYMFDIQGSFYDLDPFVTKDEIVAITNAEIDAIVAS